MWKTKKNKVSWRLEFDKAWKSQTKKVKALNKKQYSFDKPKTFDLNWIV